jgi:large subunit ribosomal protein L4
MARTAPVVSAEGGPAGEVALSEAIFGAPVARHVLHAAVVMQLAGRRAGTAATRGRSAVRGGGRKPWRQKGTGRARAGTRRSPVWVGGGTVFGPTPRSYAYRIPKRVARAARRGALSDQAARGRLRVLEGLALERPSTKGLAAVLAGLDLGAARRTILVVPGPDPVVARSARNLPGVTVRTPEGLSVAELVAADAVVFTREALGRLEEALGR